MCDYKSLLEKEQPDFSSVWGQIFSESQNRYFFEFPALMSLNYVAV